MGKKEKTERKRKDKMKLKEKKVTIKQMYFGIVFNSLMLKNLHSLRKCFARDYLRLNAQSEGQYGEHY